jgi:hypothetical protein
MPFEEGVRPTTIFGADDCCERWLGLANIYLRRRRVGRSQRNLAIIKQLTRLLRVAV